MPPKRQLGSNARPHTPELGLARHRLVAKCRRIAPDPCRYASQSPRCQSERLGFSAHNMRAGVSLQNYALRKIAGVSSHWRIERHARPTIGDRPLAAA